MRGGGGVRRTVTHNVFVKDNENHISSVCIYIFKSHRNSKTEERGLILHSDARLYKLQTICTYCIINVVQGEGKYIANILA